MYKRAAHLKHLNCDNDLGTVEGGSLQLRKLRVTINHHQGCKPHIDIHTHRGGQVAPFSCFEERKLKFILIPGSKAI